MRLLSPYTHKYTHTQHICTTKEDAYDQEGTANDRTSHSSMTHICFTITIIIIHTDIEHMISESITHGSVYKVGSNVLQEWTTLAHRANHEKR